MSFQSKVHICLAPALITQEVAQISFYCTIQQEVFNEHLLGKQIAQMFLFMLTYCLFVDLGVVVGTFVKLCVFDLKDNHMFILDCCFVLHCLKCRAESSISESSQEKSYSTTFCIVTVIYFLLALYKIYTF